ncbi:LOW QUALITY PROTEIN: hypothetical protein C923_03136 [Plasmodium falciparum UGT5.1]|uniref:Uncharacterized protein n=2 Tax=Plasmodium falciparum TaxID=5833 RepID=A0A024WNY6_PLAFA|nr:LOW QUALITY PROTEIN: hypothetical protein PFMALIP_03057 [Plasmodium falciparum MaliPS096_E11]EWC76210.1 LOW QUALITY PROTEIN: hypothetical protein C923_03136 [Plasmodium falciparum UGT5.1]
MYKIYNVIFYFLNNVIFSNNEYIRRTYKRYINLKNKHNEKNVLSINADEDKISNGINKTDNIELG